MNGFRQFVSTRRSVLILIAVIGLSLSTLGMRVPNLSRPHSPKPTHRAVIEYPTKSVQQCHCKDVYSGVIFCSQIRLPALHAGKLRTYLRHETIPVVTIAYVSSRAPPLILA